MVFIYLKILWQGVFFSWEASWSKVLTLDQLKQRGRALAIRCFLCEEEEETVEHLLVHCSKARTLWDLILAIVGSARFSTPPLETLFSWHGSFVGKKMKESLDGSPSMSLLDYLAQKI